MSPSPNADRQRALIEKEGTKYNTYLDTRDKRTIGTGINLDDPSKSKYIAADLLSGERTTMTEEEELASRQQATKIAQDDALNFVGIETHKILNPVAQQVLFDMSYNMGGPTLNKFKKLRGALQVGDYQEAARQIIDSDYFRAKDTNSRALENAQKLMAIGQ